MGNLEEFDDTPIDVEAVPVPQSQPGWARTLAWAIIILGGVYMINPTAGIFELLPDALPIVGNLDEAAIVFLMIAAMRYLGMRLPDFIERWTQPALQLPASLNPKEE